jgi:MinD-like ATPase involved in chromosome partitioning or flagellar assembly
MANTVLVHSFRPGVGRSNIVANVAYLAALQGYRVGVLDGAVDSALPGLFGLGNQKTAFSFADLLAGKCISEQVVLRLGNQINTNITGDVFFVVGDFRDSTGAPRNTPKDSELLNVGCQKLIESLNLDLLIIDTQPGLKNESLVPLTIADILLIVLRHDGRDYQGTSVTLDIVRQLNIPRMMLVVNETPGSFNSTQVTEEVEKNLNCEVAAVLPHIEELMVLGNQEIFAHHYPNHPATDLFKQIVQKLVI